MSLIPPCLLLLLALVSAQEQAMYCRDHPAYYSSLNIPLIRSWRHYKRPSMVEKVFYKVNYDDHHYFPYGEPTSTKYRNLDLFYSSGYFANQDKLVTMYFQRPAKVYFFIGVNRQSTNTAVLPGWKSEGYAMLADASGHPARLPFGIHQHSSILLPQKVYVFSRQVMQKIDIPTRKLVNNAMKRITTLVFYHIRVAEADGSAFAGIGQFGGRTIKSNEQCPPDLHAAWSVPHKDRNDASMDGKKFFSWHPSWDPCYWCAYSHEHGSNPKALMNYDHAFGYTALKNSNEAESDEGFKAYIFEYGNYIVYVNVHVQTGQLRRATARYHTIALVIVRKSDKSVVFEVTHKGDFGFLSVRSKTDNFIPIRREDEAIHGEQLRGGHGIRKFRSINLLPGPMNPKFKYRPDMYEGVYEAWATVPICCKTRKYGGIHIDIKNPGTGIRSVGSLARVNLHRQNRLNVGTNRMIRVSKMTCGIEYCEFDNMESSGVAWPPADGVFYTNANGTLLYAGPGRGAIRQFAKPGFEVYVHQDFIEATENGAGMHKAGVGFFPDHGYGIDPERN